MPARVRLGAGHRLRALAFCLIPVALVLSHRNLVIVVLLVGLTGLAATVRRAPPRWAWPLLALVAYAAASTLWSPALDDRDWAVRGPVFAALTLGALAAARGARPGEARLFGLAALAACLLLGVEAATGGAIRDLVPPEGRPAKDDVATARGVGLGVLMLPGAALCLARGLGGRAGTIAAGAAALCLAAGAARFGVTANALALGAALAAAALAWRRPGLGVGVVAGAFLALLILAPMAALLPPPEAVEGWTAGPVSWRQRVVIWHTVGQALTAEPPTFLLGAGQHASAVLGEGAGTVTLAGLPVPLPRVPSHPHDVPLQLWYELGALGAALLGAGVVLGARAFLAALPRRDLAAAACGAGAALLVILAVDASLWTLWRTSGAVLGAYGLVLAARAPSYGPAAR